MVSLDNPDFLDKKVMLDLPELLVYLDFKVHPASLLQRLW